MITRVSSAMRPEGLGDLLSPAYRPNTCSCLRAPVLGVPTHRTAIYDHQVADRLAGCMSTLPECSRPPGIAGPKLDRRRSCATHIPDNMSESHTAARPSQVIA